MRRRGSETRPRIGGPAARDSCGASGQVDDILEGKLRGEADGMQESDRANKPTILDKAPMTQSPSERDQQDNGALQRTEAGHIQNQHQLLDESNQQHLSGTMDLASIEWSYLDTQGMVQGEYLRSLGGRDSELAQVHFVQMLCNPGTTRDTLPRIS